MANAQFIAMTTSEAGPTGLIKRTFASGFKALDEAPDVMAARLKPGETSNWLDQQTRSIRPVKVQAL